MNMRGLLAVLGLSLMMPAFADAGSKVHWNKKRGLGGAGGSSASSFGNAGGTVPAGGFGPGNSLSDLGGGPGKNFAGGNGPSGGPGGPTPDDLGGSGDQLQIDPSVVGSINLGNNANNAKI